MCPRGRQRVCADASASARTRTCVRTDACTSAPWMPRQLERLHKGSSNIPFSLPSLPWPGEATVHSVHFVVWATIGGFFFGHTCRSCVDQVFFYSTF
jgi:hypothetical protein